MGHTRIWPSSFSPPRCWSMRPQTSRELGDAGASGSDETRYTRTPRHFDGGPLINRMCLDFSTVRGNPFDVMTKWSLRRFALIAVGALLALSMSASAVLAGSMAVQMDEMTVSSTMDGSEHRGCDGCATGEDMAASCVAVCGVSLFAMLADMEPAAIQTASGRLRLPRVEPLLGSSSPPNPSPPRTTYIG